MQTGMRGREEAMEKQFQHEKEVEFKIKVRANRLLGYWAAKELGLSGVELREFNQKILDLSVQTADAAPVLNKLLTAFEKGQIPYTLHQLEKQLEYCLEDARHEFNTGLYAPQPE